jgi:HlyD family secretion protein
MRKLLIVTAILIALSGCARRDSAARNDESQPPSGVSAVTIVHPEKKAIKHVVEQPGFNVEAYQETPLYSRISGYVKKWHRDIGDSVKKDEVLADLYVPEMEVDVKQKEAAVKYAAAQIDQAKAAVLTARAQTDRLKSQYERLAKAGLSGVLDKESVDESRLNFESAKATLEKAKADEAASEAGLDVAKAHRDYASTMLKYAQLRAPYDGVVTKRYVNTGDFVQPAGSGTTKEPLYVVQQIDPVRVFINVPGSDAAWVKDNDVVMLRLQGSGGELFPGKVTRTSHSLNPHTRTLRTEIDLANAKGKLLPGMYVQASIAIQHDPAWTLPTSAVVTDGDDTFCYRVIDDKAVRTPLQVGLRGGGLVEVLKIQARPARGGEPATWEDVTDNVEVVGGDAAVLTDGQPVRRAEKK